MKRFWFRAVASAWAISWFAFSTTSLEANGLIREGVGPISSGRGGTNLGFADNGAILLDNPAAMVNVAGTGLAEAAVDTAIVGAHYTDLKPNNVQALTRPLPLPEAALIRKSADGDFAWGAGIFVPAGFGATYDMQNSFAGPQQYKSLGELIKILPGISYRLTDRLSIGGTLGIAFSQVDFQGPFYLPSGPLAGVPTIINFRGTGVAPTGSIGLQYVLNSRTTLGLNFTTESRLHLGGNTQTNIFGLAPFPLYSQFGSTAFMSWPRSLALGIKHDLSTRHRVSADVIWYDWKNSFNNIDLTLTNPSNPLVAGAAGSTINQTLPLRWHDTVSLRLGYEFRPNRRDVWRLGYAYSNSPVPNSTLNPYIDGVVQDFFTAGYSRRMGRAILNIAYQYGFSPTRHIGVSALPGGDFSNSTYNAHVHFANIGILVPF